VCLSILHIPYLPCTLFQPHVKSVCRQTDRHPPLNLRWRRRAPIHCRIAQFIVNSGATSAHNIISTLLSFFFIHPSSEAGMLGCIEAQVQAKIVTRQLQTISKMVRLDGQRHVGSILGELASVGMVDRGAALVRCREKYRRPKTMSMATIRSLSKG